jgi:hypothetical protein
MTQEQSILQYMKKVGPITPIEALSRFGCFRLGARVYDLRHKGHNITRRIVKCGRSHVAQYSIRREEK